MDETIMSVVLGVMLPLVIKKGKQLGIPPLVSHGLVAFGIALPVVAFHMFAPEEMKVQAFQLYSQTLTVAFWVYNISLKKRT